MVAISRSLPGAIATETKYWGSGGGWAVAGARMDGMCRNITILRGLQPAATAEEIEAAARQYVRKVSGVQSVSAANEEPFELAVRRVTEATTELLATLPPRKQPPTTVPPLRRPEVRARLSLT